MTNPFYIQPVDISSGLQGLGKILAAKQGLDLKREEQAKKDQRFADYQAAARRAQTPEDFARLALSYPEHAKAADLMIEQQSRQMGLDRQTMTDLYKKAALSPDPADVFVDWIAANQDSKLVEPLVNDIGWALNDPEQFKDYTLKMWASADPDGYGAAMSGRAGAGDKPMSQREYEYYTQLSPPEQQEYLRVKRGDQQSVADKILLAQEQSRIKREGEKKSREEQSRAEAIDHAINKTNQFWDLSSTYQRMIDSLDEGASIGALSRYLPTMRSSTAQFEQAARELGLDVISSTTFGALSAPELQIAMETAVPPISDPQEMRNYLLEKQAAQEKLAGQMLDYISHLQSGGTKVEWIKMQANLRKGNQGSKAGQTPTAQREKDKFVVGSIYDDPESNESARYLGNGEWEEVRD